MRFLNELQLYWPDEENVKDALHAHARIDAIDAALKHVRRRNGCVQAGGWVGMWPLRLAKEFKTVCTFEPVPHLYECLKANVMHHRMNNVIATSSVALGPFRGELDLTVALSGCTSANLPLDAKNQSRVLGKRTVPMFPLDEALRPDVEVNAIFLDVERYEIDVLEGAKQVLKKFNPVISVEVLKGEREKVFEWMEAHEYQPRERVHNDWIFTR